MRKIALSLACLCLAAPAFAQDEQVVVSATRSEQPLDKTGESVSVITGDELQTQQISVLSDALEEIPGVTIIRDGGIGQATTMSIRGAAAGQSLTLIDGVRINDPSTADDEAVLGDVLTNNVDRVEVLRGPQSTLYGSDAIGGVVNILTKRGGDTPFALTAEAEGGSFDTAHLNAAADGTLGDVEYGSAINAYLTDGISAADSRNGNTETDGYNNLGGTLNARYHINDTMSLDLRGYATEARNSFDDNYLPPDYNLSDSGAYSDNQLLAGYAGFNIDLLNNQFHNRIAMIASDSDRRFFNSAADIIHKNSDFEGDAVRFEYQGIFDVLPDNELTFGAETQHISFTSTDFFSYMPTEIDKGHSQISSGYAQDQMTFFDQLTVTGGVRYDDDSNFGGHTSLKVAGAWTPNNGATVLHANYGDGFKAPTLYELFSPYSNPLRELLPETARGWEAGATQRFLDGRVHVSATYFERRTNNQIGFFQPDCFSDPIPPTCAARPYGYYDNIARARATGEEYEATADLGDNVSASADVTDLSAVDLTLGTPLQRSPHYTASGNLTWAPATNETLGFGIVYVGDRFDGADRFNPMSSYTTANVFGSYPVYGNFSLFARVENVFDEHYEPVLGYGAAGRSAFAGLRVTL
ncbi:MAG TPA: TonB-dependent receptor [Rhizomicrobium sp.]|nr:TonB-dependent receptor [Rhizomicrobium sp.]